MLRRWYIQRAHSAALSSCPAPGDIQHGVDVMIDFLEQLSNDNLNVNENPSQNKVRTIDARRSGPKVSEDEPPITPYTSFPSAEIMMPWRTK